MKTLLVGLTALALVAPFAAATHDTGTCTIASAPAGDLIEFDTPPGNPVDGGKHYYWEERGNPLGTSPPVPLSGFILGGGTWLYHEANGQSGMQRGGIGITGACFPPDPLPCVLIDEDPINDENCGHGRDQIIF